MRSVDLAWKPLDGASRFLLLTYPLTFDRANSLAVLLDESRWLVINPPPKPPADVYQTLRRNGTVTCLVAPNAYHQEGQISWKREFPDAICYSPRATRTRLNKKTPGIVYQPIEALSRQSPELECLVPVGMKSPDLLLSIQSNLGNIWWASDHFSNSERGDSSRIAQAVSGILGRGYGYRCNRNPERLYVRDRIAWLISIRSFLARFPPSMVIPGHGKPVADCVIERTRLALCAMDTRKGGGREG